jgi:hypothetical protein
MFLKALLMTKQANKVRGIFVTECAGMPFQKFFLRRTQPGKAFQNLLFLGSV